jgi:hypothetical protein
MFKFLDSELEGKRFCSEWYQALLDLNLLLICSWIEFDLLSFVPNFQNSFTLSKELLSLFILWLGPAFWSPDMTVYSVPSAITSSPIPIV